MSRWRSVRKVPWTNDGFPMIKFLERRTGTKAYELLRGGEKQREKQEGSALLLHELSLLERNVRSGCDNDVVHKIDAEKFGGLNHAFGEL